MSRNAHRVVGALGFLTFLGTGLYMATQFPGLYERSEAIRYQFRANHGYILLSSLANVLVGLSITAELAGWRRRAAGIASVLLLLAVPVFITAFFVEPPRASPERPITTAGMVLMLTGTALQAVSWLRRGSPAPTSP